MRPVHSLLLGLTLSASLSSCTPHHTLKPQPPLTTPEAPAPQPSSPPQLQGADLAKLCDEATKLWRCSSAPQAAPDDSADEDDEQTPLGECACTVTKTTHVNTSKGPFKAAAILSVEGSDGFVSGSIDGAEHLAVETVSGGWQHVGLLTNNYAPGAGGFFNSGSLESVSFQTNLDQEVLIVRYSNLGSERDLSTKTSAESTAQRMLLCAKTSQGAQCIELGIGGERRTRALFDDEEDATARPPGEQWTALATLTPQGKLKYAMPGQQPHAPDYARALVGERTLDEVATIAAQHQLAVTSLR